MVTTDTEDGSYEKGSEWTKPEFERMQKRAGAFVGAGDKVDAESVNWALVALGESL